MMPPIAVAKFSLVQRNLSTGIKLFWPKKKIFLRSAGKAVTKKTSSCYDFVFKIFFARKKSLSRCVVIRRSNDAKNFLMTFFCRRRNVVDKKSTKNGTATATEQYFARTFQKISEAGYFSKPGTDPSDHL